jgi:alanine dehydrogenase
MSLLTLYKIIEEVRVCDLNEKTRDDCIVEMRQMHGNIAKIIPAENDEDAVKGVDIVVTTTPSRKPIVLDEWVEPGMHFNCIGADAPSKQEMDPAILKRAKIVVDDWEQTSHSGEINVPLSQGLLKLMDIWGEMGEVVAGIKQGRTASDEITVFDATGLAILDARAHVKYFIQEGCGKWHRTNNRNLVKLETFYGS